EPAIRGQPVSHLIFSILVHPHDFTELTSQEPRTVLAPRGVRVTGVKRDVAVRFQIIPGCVDQPSTSSDSVALQARGWKGLGLEPFASAFVAIRQRRTAQNF